MDKEQLKQLAARPEFIPGIHNYCDRWCARCPFTSRCLNYAMQREHMAGAADASLDGPDLWSQMKETFDATLALLQDLADRAGIDLTDVLSSSDEPSPADVEAHAHPLAHASRVYAARVEAWFAQAGTLFDEKNRSLARQAGLDLEGPEHEAAVLQDALEVVQWYRQQIHVKLIRAVRSRLNAPPGRLPGDLPGALPDDADGSAKVALLGMDRSVDAWHVLYDHFPEQEDAILPLLVHLQRMRRATEAAFPGARAFIRPGFDDA